MIGRSFFAGLLYILRRRVKALSVLPITGGRFWVACCTLVLVLWMPVKAQQPIEIVALGDSLTAGYGLGPRDGFVPQLQAALGAAGHQVKLVNAGVSGDTSSGGLARLDWVVGAGTQMAIVELGANDALRGINPEITRRNLAQIIEKLQARNIKILLAGMLAPPNMGPDYAAAFNPIYPQLAARYGVTLYPFFLDGVAAQRQLNLADGIHPNRQGIALIVARILPSVEQVLADIHN